ncbi:MAG: protease pro-enzyme activation domain-containing protein, partial [Candidatus Aquilonibacter sp.]
MIRSLRTLSVAAVCAMLLSACGGGGGGAGIPASGGAPTLVSTLPASPNTSNFSWGQPLLHQLSYSAPVTVGSMSVQVLVSMQNPQGLMQYAAQVSDPRSGLYRHWLTPQQIAAQYGASASDYATVAKYFASNGLHVGGWPQRETLEVTGSLAAFTKAFGTGFGMYTFEGKPIVAPTGVPHFSTPLPVAAVYGLVAAQLQHAYIIHNNNASYFGYSPQQISSGFDYSGAWSAGYTGSGVKVGIIGTGPILQSNGSDADSASLATLWNAKMATITQVAATNQPPTTLNGGTGTGAVDNAGPCLTSPPPVTGPCTP